VIGRAVWWVVSRALQVPSIDSAMLDELPAVMRERAVAWGVVVEEAA
jgi:hypothetical protein